MPGLYLNIYELFSLDMTTFVAIPHVVSVFLLCKVGKLRLHKIMLILCYGQTFNPSHAAIIILINATAAEFICKNIFSTPVQVKKIIKNKIGDILTSIRLFIKCKFILFY